MIPPCRLLIRYRGVVSNINEEHIRMAVPTSNRSARNPINNAITAVNKDLLCDSAEIVVARIRLSRFSVK